MTLQRLLEEIAMTSCMIFFGVVLVHATRQKWRLVDPPESWWWLIRRPW
jgi:hypothetical protein